MDVSQGGVTMISSVNINYAVYYRKQGRQEETKRQNDNQSIVERLFDKIEISSEAKAASQTSHASQTSQASQAPPGSAQIPGGGFGGEPGSGGFIYKPADSESGFTLPQSTDDELKKAFGAIKAENMRAKADEQSNNGNPKDETQRLTRALVAAKTTMEVQNVLSEAFKCLFPLQMAAAKGDEKAAAIVIKLNKLISRSNRKIRDLNKEESLRMRKDRAEKREQKNLEEQARLELKRAEQERKQREKKYLHEAETAKNKFPGIPSPSLAATEAKIRALAQQMAQNSSMTVTGNISVPGLDGSTISTDGGSAAADASQPAGDIAV